MTKPARLVIQDGTIEAMKWLALVLMTIDHVNKYLLGDSVPGMYDLGRVAMPLFSFVFAYNLARPGAFERGVHLRAVKHLVIYGLVATPVFIGLGGLAWGWYPFNIMFMLATAAGVLYLSEQGGAARIAAAVALFLVGGAMVEFWWFAVAFVVLAWWYTRTTSRAALLLMAVALALLVLVNRNLWALAVLPLILVAPRIKVEVPRVRKLFYTYYPAHLAAILVLSTALGRHV